MNFNVDTKPQKRRSPLFVLVFLIISIILIWYDIKFRSPLLNQKAQQLNQNYLNSLNESFKGTIISKKTLEMQHAGEVWLTVLKLKLFESTINYYDPRDTADLYYCVIDYPYAEVFISKEFDDIINIGDTCSFDGQIDLFCIKPVESTDPELKCWKPKIINSNVRKLGRLFTLPKYSEQERKIKEEGLQYKTDNPNKFYRFFLGKFKTKGEIKKLKNSYEESSLINDCFNDKAYIILKKNNTNYLFHRLSFYNLNHIAKYDKLINNPQLKIAEFNSDGELVRILVKK